MLSHRELLPLDAWPCCHDLGRVARFCCDRCTLVACCCVGMLPHAGCARRVVRAVCGCTCVRWVLRRGRSREGSG
eukprot:1284908-Alexandrium_andersonii.AAC.1